LNLSSYIKHESNPGSVRRLGTCLIHASLLKGFFFDGVQVSKRGEWSLLFGQSQ
jgi:hypothetical protein